MKALGVVVTVVCLALFGVFAGLSAVLSRQAMQAVVPVALLVFVAGYMAFLARALRGKKVVLDVDRDRLLVDEGRGGVFPLAGAALGLWRISGTGVTAGTVLHLAGGKRPLRIAGRDHRPGPALRLDAPPVQSIDVLLPADAFEALLAWVPSLAAAPHHAARGPLRCQLLVNPASLRGGLSVMAPWLLTMALVSAVSIVLGSLDVFASAAGQKVAIAIILVIIAAGLVMTVVRSMRKSPALEIEADPRGLLLRDPRSGQILAAAPLGAVSTARGFSRMRTRGGEIVHTTLVLRIPGHSDVSLAVQDMRFGWVDAVPSLPTPRYVVGAPDWFALVDLLGVRRFLVVQDDGFV
ncbi:hypothetical protein [Sorangium sp. So ce1024]|uniref:hypothetical protein n=1 Tax=Sorangium sp. So ce1024 TaxID=3133327 RepID=UPI003F0D2342